MTAALAEYLVVLDDGGSYLTRLTAAQGDGISCVRCGASEGPKVPVGRCYPDEVVTANGGVQAFACAGKRCHDEVTA